MSRRRDGPRRRTRRGKGRTPLRTCRRVCGIAALLDPTGASATDAGQRMADALRHRGPDGQAVEHLRPRDAGQHPPGDHRRRGRRPAAVLRGRPDSAGGQRRDLQPPRPRAGARGARPPLRHRLGLRGAGARLRAGRASTSWTRERDVRPGAVGRAREPPGRGARPLRGQARVLVERRQPNRGGLRDRRADRRGPGQARDRPGRRSTTTSRAASCPGREPSSRACRSSRPASCSSPPRTASRRSGASAGRRIREIDEDDLVRRAGGELHRRGRAADDVRRPLRRPARAAAWTRRRSSPRWRRAPTSRPITFTVGFPGAGDVLDEREAAAQSARLLGSDHHEHRHGPGRLPDRAGRSRAPPRGAVRDPLGARAAAALALRRPGREGRPLGAGRRRAPRRLRPPPGGGAARAPCRGSRARWPGSPPSCPTNERDGSGTCSARWTTPNGWCGWWRSATPGCASA